MRVLRPVSDGYDVYFNGTEPWNKVGHIAPEDGRWTATFRNRTFIPTFATPQEAGMEIWEAYKAEGQAITQQITYERSMGWSTD